MNATLRDIFGTLLFITGIFDAIKYHIQANKVVYKKSSNNLSRKFTNFAIINDLVKTAYGIIIMDWFIISTSLLAMVCMLRLWWVQYLYYPFKMRGCYNFKRPHPILYLYNSLQANSIRKRL